MGQGQAVHPHPGMLHFRGKWRAAFLRAPNPLTPPWPPLRTGDGGGVWPAAERPAHWVQRAGAHLLRRQAGHICQPPAGRLWAGGCIERGVSVHRGMCACGRAYMFTCVPGKVHCGFLHAEPPPLPLLLPRLAGIPHCLSLHLPHCSLPLTPTRLLTSHLPRPPRSVSTQQHLQRRWRRPPTWPPSPRLLLTCTAWWVGWGYVGSGLAALTYCCRQGMLCLVCGWQGLLGR